MTCRYAHLAPSVELEPVDDLASTWKPKIKEAADRMLEATREREAANDHVKAMAALKTPIGTKTNTRVFVPSAPEQQVLA